MTRAFRYSFQALEALYDHQLDEAQRALASAGDALHAAQDESLGVQAVWQGHFSTRTGAPLDLVRQELLRQQIDADHHRLTQAASKVAECKAAWTQCQSMLERALQRCEMLKRHKSQARTAHQRESVRLASLQADDAWLMHRSDYDAA